MVALSFTLSFTASVTRKAHSKWSPNGHRFVQDYNVIKSNAMIFPRTQPLQAASIYSQQTTAQQIGGIDISTLINLILPAMAIGMMAKMMSSTLGKKKQAKSTTENTISQSKKATTSG